MTMPNSGEAGPPPSGAAPPRGRAWLRAVVLVLLAGAVVFLFLRQPGAPAGEGAAGRAGGGPDAARGPRPIAVVTAPVETGTVVERAEYPGELDADAADVAANVAARLVAVEVRLGDTVAAGQVLARVDDAELLRQRDEAVAEERAAKAARRSAAVRLEAARREAKRVARLAKDRLVSAQEADRLSADVDALAAEVEAAAARQAQAAARIALLEQRIAECTVVAPFAGTVAARLRDPGGYVQPGTPLVRLVARAPLRIRFDVPEGDLGGFAPGATFLVTARATGTRPVEGRVTGVAAESDRARRVVPVEGVIGDPPPGWLPGMYARVVAVRRSFEDVLRVPAVAVLSRLAEDGTVTTGVFRATDGTARWVPVTVLGREGEGAAIDGPLVAGEAVLVSGHTELSDGAPVRVVQAAGGPDVAGGETRP